jgi:hypothetical protein
MSKSYKAVHDFQSVNLSQSLSQINLADSSLTVSNAYSGDVILLNATGGSSVSLPAPNSGLHFTFVVSNTGAHSIAAPSACINGAVANAVFNTGANLATGAAKTTISTTAGSVIGDTIRLVSTDSKYYLSGNVSNFNAITFA